MRVDSKTREIIEHRKTSIEYVKSLIEMTLTPHPEKEKTSSIQNSYETMKDD